MAAEDCVRARYARGHLEVDVHAVVRKDDDDLRPFAPRRIHGLLHVLFLDAEGPVGRDVTGMRDQCVGEGLADDGDLHAVDVANDVRFENGIAEIRGLYVLRDDFDLVRKVLLRDFEHAILTVCAFPVQGHDVDAERELGVDHVLALGPHCGARALPGIAAVEQQRAGTLRLDAFDERREMGEAADLAVDAGVAFEVEIGKGVSETRVGRNLEMLEEILADDMRRLARHSRDADVDVRLAEIDGQQLCMTIGDMQQGDVAESRRVIDALGVLLGLRETRRGRHAGHAGSREHIQKFTTVHGPVPCCSTD